MQTNRIQRCTGLLCAAVFAVAALSGTAAPSVRAAASGENVTGDLLEIEEIPLDADSAALQMESIPVYGASSTTVAYAEDRYASHAGYDTLNAEQKQLYNAMREAAHTFYIGDADAESVSYSTGSMDCCMAVDSGSRSLTKEDVIRVISMFRNDNPIYFFMGGSFLYSSDYDFWTGESYIATVYLSCAENCTDGAERMAERKILENRIIEVETEVNAGETALEKARIAHDWLVDTNTYAYDADGSPDSSMISHSIVGIFDAQYHTAVCEGYAKSFQLLMNAADVSNFYIVGLGNGGGHAWNMAQMDNGYYYYFDATWDDTAQTSKYFAAGETSFSQDHTPYAYDKSGWEFLYDLPDVPNADYDFQPGTVYYDGDYTYRLFDEYAALTDYTGDSEQIAVSKKVNGLPVQVIQGAFTGNTTLQTVELPETLLELSYGADGVGAFEGCSSLQSVTLRGETMPVSLTRVAYHAFRNCAALTQISLPVTVSRIGAAAFENCDALYLLEIYAKSCNFVSSTSVVPTAIISGYTGSTAQTYAKKFNREFVELGTAIVTTTSETVTTTTTTTTTTSTTTTTTTTQTTTTMTATDTTTTTEATTLPTAATSVTTSAVETTTTSASTALLEERLIGDVNGDGICAIDDLVMLNQYLLGVLYADTSQLAAMDCYADGEIDMRDSLILEHFLVYMIDEIPVEP